MTSSVSLEQKYTSSNDIWTDRNWKLSLQIAGVIQLACIRSLYLWMTVTALEPVWYPGSGGYGIEFSPIKEIPSLALFIISSVAISPLFYKRKVDFTEMCAGLLFIVYYVPLSTSYAIHDLGAGYFLGSNLFALLLIYLLSRGCQSDRNEKKNISDFLDNKTINSICILICILIIIYKIFYNGFSINLSLDSEDVYANRADFLTYKNGISGTFAAYLITFFLSLANYIVPVYLYATLQRKNYFGSILGLYATLSIFSLSSSKSSIYFMAILLFVLLAQRLGNSLNNPFPVLLTCFLLLMGIGLISYVAFKSDWLYMAIIRRAMYMPVWIGTMYFDFFGNNTPLFFSDSAMLLQNIMPSQYDSGVLTLISNTYFNGVVPSPNSGLLSEAVMQLGVIGLVVYPVVLSALLRRCGTVYSCFGQGLSLVIAAKLTMQLMNVPFLRTDFVLSFFAFSILIAFLMHGRGGTACVQKN